MKLEIMASIGVAIFLLGLAYSASLLLKWIESGFGELPFLYQDLIAFLLVFGLQTFFSSFFISMLGD